MPIHHLCHGLSLGLSVAGAMRRSQRANQSQVRTVVIGPQPGVVATTASTPTTVPYQAMDANPNDYQHYNASGAKITGIIQMVAGCISALIGIALIIIIPITPSFVAVGIWGGALFFISGIIGTYAASRRQKALIVSYLVLSIISAVVAGIAGAIYMQSAISLSVVYRIEQVSIIPFSEYIGFSAALAAVLFIECITAAMASGVGCCGLCCTPVDNNLTYNQMIVQPNHPYGFYTNGPPPMVQGQTLGLVPNTFIPVAQPGGQIPGPGPNSTVVTVPINA